MVIFVIDLYCLTAFHCCCACDFLGKAFKQSLDRGVVAKLSAYDVIMHAAEVVTSPNANYTALCAPEKTSGNMQVEQLQ